MDKDAQAREMFAKGYTIHTVAERLAVEFSVARGWKQDFDAANKRRELQTVPETSSEDTQVEEEAEEMESFELVLPTRLMAELFRTFTNAEQGSAIATVLQQRLDKAIEAFDTTGEGEDDQQAEGTAA